MTDSDKIQFAKSMAELGISFGRSVDKETLAVYFKHLSKLTIYQVCTAIEEIISKDEHFPNVSRVKALASIKKHQPPQPVEDVPQIEERVLPNDLPKNKEDFFKAMNKLYGNVDLDGGGCA